MTMVLPLATFGAGGRPVPFVDLGSIFVDDGLGVRQRVGVRGRKTDARPATTAPV